MNTFKQVFSAVNTYCTTTLTADAIIPLVTPSIENMKYILQLDGERYFVPLNQPNTLWELPEFNKNLSLVILVTGWTTNASDSNNAALNKIYSAYRCRGNIKFVVIDTAGFIDTFYTWSAFNTEKIGSILAESLVILTQTFPFEKIHLIGHSLGAHIVGSAGRHFSNITNRKIHRITGLDPANPCFNSESILTGLHRGDAKFVLVIHSNPGGLGKRDSMGDVDFYPNGFEPLPPGCLSMSCAHLRAVEYYAESVYPGNEYNFLAKKCSSLQAYRIQRCHGKIHPMGFATPMDVKGNFFLETNAESPFGKNAANNFNACFFR